MPFFLVIEHIREIRILACISYVSRMYLRMELVMVHHEHFMFAALHALENQNAKLACTESLRPPRWVSTGPVVVRLAVMAN